MSTRSSQERSVRNCLTDEGRPLGVGLQERTSNRRSAAMVKSHGRERERKRPGETGSGVMQEEDCKETTVEVSKPIRRCQNRGVITTAGQAPTEPVYGRGGIRHERWPELAKEAVRRNMGSFQVMLRENL